MSARRKARRRALDVLFSADVREQQLEDALADANSLAKAQPERQSSWDYAWQILQGVSAHLAEIDETISTRSQSWPLDRMPAVDRAILRIGVWEILYNPDVAAAVAISEAVELAGELSTEASGSFVHGVLASVAKTPGVA